LCSPLIHLVILGGRDTDTTARSEALTHLGFLSPLKHIIPRPCPPLPYCIHPIHTFPSRTSTPTSPPPTRGICYSLEPYTYQSIPAYSILWNWYYTQRCPNQPTKSAAHPTSLYIRATRLFLYKRHTINSLFPPSKHIFTGKTYTSLLFTRKLNAKMCDFTKNYYIYMSCIDPGLHFCSTSTDGSRQRSCPMGPHERYIVIPESCPLCSG
jgi:hypothetical protein